MAGDAFILGFGEFRLRKRAGGNKEGCNSKDNHLAGCIALLVQHALHRKAGSRDNASPNARSLQKTKVGDTGVKNIPDLRGYFYYEQARMSR